MALKHIPVKRVLGSHQTQGPAGEHEGCGALTGSPWPAVADQRPSGPSLAAALVAVAGWSLPSGLSAQQSSADTNMAFRQMRSGVHCQWLQSKACLCRAMLHAIGATMVSVLRTHTGQHSATTSHAMVPIKQYAHDPCTVTISQTCIHIIMPAAVSLQAIH